jgi:hypothetical protein
VRKHLPWERQDDIIAELRANLESQVEEKERDLGRPLTAVEVEAWLKELGPPMLMAARYHAPRYLIGPALFPTYWYVLKLSAGLALLVCGVVSGVQLAVSKAGMEDVAAAVLRLPGVLMVTLACVTGVFAALEYVARQYPEKCPAIVASTVNWEPATLPPVVRRADGAAKPGSYGSAVAGLIFNVLWLSWILLIPHNPFLLMGPGVVFFRAHGILPAAPLWQFYWWIVALNVLQLAWRAVELTRGSWRTSHPVQHVAAKAMGLIPIVLLLVGPHIYLMIQGEGADATLFGTTMDQVNHWIFVGAAVITAIAGIQLAVDIGRMGMEGYRKRVAAGH